MNFNVFWVLFGGRRSFFSESESNNFKDLVRTIAVVPGIHRERGKLTCTHYPCIGSPNSGNGLSPRVRCESESHLEAERQLVDLAKDLELPRPGAVGSKLPLAISFTNSASHPRQLWCDFPHKKSTSKNTERVNNKILMSPIKPFLPNELVLEASLPTPKTHTEGGNQADRQAERRASRQAGK